MKSELVPQEDLSDLAAKINAAHGQVETALRAGLQHAHQAGVLLNEAKSRCRHGQWLLWLQGNVNFSVRTAQAYMRIADRWPELEEVKAQRVALLPYRDALAAIANSEQNDEQHLGTDDAGLPVLKQGHSYRSIGTSERFGQCYAEIDPHPDHPGFWVYAFYFGLNTDCCFVEYCGRGLRLDAEILSAVIGKNGFQAGPWEEFEAARDGNILAIQRYKEDCRSGHD
jgi:hypothetical protein